MVHPKEAEAIVNAFKRVHSMFEATHKALQDSANLHAKHDVEIGYLQQRIDEHREMIHALMKERDNG